MVDVSPVRFGILGAAGIAREFRKGVAGSESVRIDAVASRDVAKGEMFASEFGVGRVHGSYQALLDDPGIEAVYLPLPNHLHAEWAIKAAAAGKHVLCEKPLAIGGADVRAMFGAARRAGVHLVEAYPYMSQPQTLQLRALLAEGVVGRPVTISAAFGFPLCALDGTPFGDASNIRLDPQMGGGALLDAGTYAMSLIRIVAGERPVRVRASGHSTPSGVDLTVAATLEFASGLLAQLSCSMATAGHRVAVIVGDNGAIETGFSNHAPGPGGLSLLVKRGTPTAVPFAPEAVPGGNGFRLEAESFARMVREGAAAWNGASEAESLDVALALEAIAASLGSGGWAEISAE